MQKADCRLHKSAYKSALHLVCAYQPMVVTLLRLKLREREPEFGKTPPAIHQKLCNVPRKWKRPPARESAIPNPISRSPAHEARCSMNLLIFAGRAAGEAAPKLGKNLFKIAKSNAAAPLMPGSLDLSNHDPEMLAQFSISETWVGDLSSGLIRLKEWSAMLHGLSARECGLLSLMRCYDPKDHDHILELFEQAATLSSSFCFSTTIMMPNGFRQPLFCMGESNGQDDTHNGSMLGVFVFPRFKTTVGSEFARRQ